VNAPRTALSFAAIAAVWAIGLQVLGVADAFIYLAPALLILLPLVGGRYPGDTALVRARRRTRVPRAHLPQPLSRRRPLLRPLLPRGGRLVGSTVAGRGPPDPVATVPN
jgi:hypothetical protein